MKEPEQLYEPMQYILGLGGKRLRPVLTLMTTEALGGKSQEALPAALAFELFHNFSLIHDDIMDAAPLRRGQIAVHEKWDVNTGILSGDAMLIRSYQLFEHYEPILFKELVRLFSTTALEVCEGQQYDVDFENREKVNLAQYLFMIRCKTAVLLATCVKAGAMIAGASSSKQQAASQFGLNLGMAFQLQDDYLDVFGDPKAFGKQPGGDIVTNKKTYLYLKALQLSGQQERKELQHLFSIRPKDPKSKIQTVTEIYLKSGAGEATTNEIAHYTEKAMLQLEKLSLVKETEVLFRSFGEQMKGRKD